MFKPYTTLYICTGTGLDMANSVWWHRFAYSTSAKQKDDTWWNTCFQWVKAHSIANGYWYLTNIRPELGYVDVGRTSLQTNIAWGEAGLGNSEKQAELDNVNIPYNEALTGADYLVFANDTINESGDVYNADTKYAFIDRIDYINQNTARVWFTIDAIMTYQKFFTLGRCFVLQDMQFQERELNEYGRPHDSNLNYQPESIEPSDDQFVFQRCVGTTEALQNIDFGGYNKNFVASDISLVEADIQPNVVYTGLIAPKPAPSTLIFNSNDESRKVVMGIGTYFIPDRKNKAFEKLGSFNAMEHLLYSYTVPSKLVKNENTAGQEPVFCESINCDLDSTAPNTVMADKYVKALDCEFAFPNSFDDGAELTLLDSGENVLPNSYKPINLKTCYAPYNYYSISDKQGNSVEIQPQVLAHNISTEENWFKFIARIAPTVAPNVLSTLYILAIKQANGSETQPLQTLWQIPAYTMTPNNSGYNNFLPQIIANGIMGVTNIAIGNGMTNTSNAVKLLAPLIGAYFGGKIGASVGGMLGNAATATSTGLGSSFSSAGANELVQGQQNIANYVINKMYGLPKTQGGSPQNMTCYSMANAGYEIWRVHLRTELLKLIDYRFSVIGYAQNAFRYPHINIRKRWCYVQLGSVNMVPIAANNYDSGGIPFEMRAQIESRLKAGITFWNLRQAVTGGNDTGTSSVQSWQDSGIQANKNCKFVRNYGTTPDSDIVKENASFTGGYADDYTDDYEQEL